MKIRAKIPHRWSGGAGHVIPFDERQEREVSDAIGSLMLENPVFERVPDGPPPPPPPPEGKAAETGDDGPALKLATRADTVEELVDLNRQIFMEPPDESLLRQDGAPRTGTYRQLKPTLDFTEDERVAAWKSYQERFAGE